MTASKRVIYIVEDDPSFRKSTERLIRMSGFEVLAFESAHSFLAQPRIRRPACLLLDVKLPDIDGLTLQRKLRARGSNLPIIFMTGYGTIPMSVSAMKEGAVDFLPKPFKPQELRSAILKAIERDVRNQKLEREAKKIHALIDTLTPREKEVLRWIISGKLNKQIAAELGTTEKTIKVHRGRIMHKTGVASVAELVRLAEKVDISPAV